MACQCFFKEWTPAFRLRYIGIKSAEPNQSFRQQVRLCGSERTRHIHSFQEAGFRVRGSSQPMVMLTQVDESGAVERQVSRSGLFRGGGSVDVSLLGANQVSAGLIDRGKIDLAAHRPGHRVRAYKIGGTGAGVRRDERRGTERR